MAIIGDSGYLISVNDQDAFDAIVTWESLKQWSQAALDGIINEAVGNTINQWAEDYQKYHAGDLPEPSILIPGIVALPDFVPKNISRVPFPPYNPSEPQIVEAWHGGFTVEDWQYTGLCAYFKDPEAYLRSIFGEKLFNCRQQKAF